MKVNILKFAPILLLPFLSACAPAPSMEEQENCVSVGANFVASSSEFTYSCESCDGVIVYKFKLIRGQSSLCLDVTAKVKAGSISMHLTDDKGLSFYVADFNDYAEDDFAVAEFTYHVLTVTHTNFKGSYRLRWGHK